MPGAGSGQEEQGLTAKGSRVSVLPDERSQWVDGGDGSTAMCMYLMPLAVPSLSGLTSHGSKKPRNRGVGPRALLSQGCITPSSHGPCCALEGRQASSVQQPALLGPCSRPPGVSELVGPKEQN